MRVIGDPIPAAPSSLIWGCEVVCPVGTVLWGGGVALIGGIPGIGNWISTSAPAGNGWRAKFANASTHRVSFRLDAICAQKPPATRSSS